MLQRYTGTKKEKLVLNIDQELEYLYDYEIAKDDTSVLVKEAQQKEEHAGEQWDPVYRLPEHKDMAMFCSNVYKNYKKESDIITGNPWKLLYRVKGRVLAKILDGFFSELYFNIKNNYLLLAIKGSSTAGNWFTDVKNVVLNYKGGEINSAFTFGEKVRQLILKFKCKPMLLITGHSLGGYLAQIVTYTIKNFYLNEARTVCFRSEPSEDFGIYTMVFDSPAAYKQICSIHPHDPLDMKRFNLPIVNFVNDVNLVNCNSWIGPHFGIVLSIKAFDKTGTASITKRAINVKKTHPLENFIDIEINQCEKVVHLAGRKTVKYEKNCIPSVFFLTKMFELLYVYAYEAQSCDELKKKLPEFKISKFCVILKDEKVSAEEFIPRAHLVLKQFKKDLESGKCYSRDAMFYAMCRADMKEDAHDFCLNDEWKEKVGNWEDGTEIGGFESEEEMRFVGYLMHNSIPRCFYYNHDKLGEPLMDNVLKTTEITLFLIVKDKTKVEKYQGEKRAKIVFLILGGGSGEKDTLKLSALDEESQNQLKNTELQFMGNKVSALHVFGSQHLQELPLIKIIKFKKEAAIKEELFYSDQDISDHARLNKFKSATDFARELKKGELKFVMISSDAGMGKSTALKQIAKTLQNELQTFWIVHMNLFLIQNELFKAKDTFTSKKAAIELVRNATLAERKDDEVLKKVFDWKVKKKEMVILLDSLDEICPFYRDTADKFIAMLRETDLQIVVTTRPHEGKNLKDDAEIFKLEPLYSEKKRRKFIGQKFKWMGKTPPENSVKWLQKMFGGVHKYDFWSIPLTLNMAITIYNDDILNIELPNNSNIFKVFLYKSIGDTLRIKFDHDETKASCVSEYEQKTEKYNTLIEILAICTIFHGGRVTTKFQEQIAQNVEFINRFDLAKLDNECKNVSFLHRSFAEYLVAKLLIQRMQVQTQKTTPYLSNKKLKKVLFDEEYSEIRKHICAILAADPTLKLNFASDIIKGDKQKLLKTLIENDCFELYLQLRMLQSFRPDKKLVVLNKKMHPLHLALSKARKEFVRELINDGAKFEEILKENCVLHLAVRNDLYGEVEHHFDSLKSNINEETHGGFLPLQIAAANGSREMVEFLIEKGADINANDILDRTALSCAIEAHSVQVVELLIAKGADLSEGLKWAAKSNEKEIFSIIYENTKDEYKEKRLREAHFIAAKKGHLEMFQYLCGFSEENSEEILDEDGNTFLHVAAKCGHLHCIESIWRYQKQEVDVRNSKGETPLMCALEWGNEEVVEWLLDKNADIHAVDDEGQTCLHHAAWRGEVRCVKMLLKAGAYIDHKDKEGWTALFHASRGQIDAIKYLLEKKSNPQITDNEGNTCLHIASKNYKLECVELLVEYLPVNCENLKKETPLHLAAYKGMEDIVEYLLEKGAEIDAKDEKGWTALFHASYGGKEHVVKYLLQKKADSKITDKKGNTCLHIASKSEYWNGLECVKLLVEYLPVNCENHKNETPLHSAGYKGIEKIVAYLLLAGSERNLEATDGQTILRLTEDVFKIRCSKNKDIERKKSEISRWRYSVKDVAQN
jgi:ankyrin repeat protein